MKLGDKLKLRERALQTLSHDESEALEALIKESSPENRARFREIHDTVQMIRSDVNRERGLLSRLLKLLRLIP